MVLPLRGSRVAVATATGCDGAPASTAALCAAELPASAAVVVAPAEGSVDDDVVAQAIARRAKNGEVRMSHLRERAPHPSKSAPVVDGLRSRARATRPTGDALRGPRRDTPAAARA